MLGKKQVRSMDSTGIDQTVETVKGRMSRYLKQTLHQYLGGTLYEKGICIHTYCYASHRRFYE